MITLSQAVKLIQAEDSECIWLARAGEHKACWKIMSVKEMRRKLDMKKVKVIRIDVDFYHDGEWKGWVFVVRGL